MPVSGQWRSSRRKSELRAGWHAIRTKVIARAGRQCERILPDGTRCQTVGTDVHHIGNRDDHSLNNLALLCIECHAIETQAQALAAQRSQLDKLRHPSQRSTAKPPGLL